VPLSKGIGKPKAGRYGAVMPRFALKIEYDGQPFCGWQRQKDQPSVQGNIEDALRVLDPALVGIQGAGRTDTGVHATGQVAHCDLVKDWDPFRLSEALNFHLKPEPIVILAAAKVDDLFSARISATARHYLFRVQSRRAPLTHERGHVWRVAHPLDLTAMQDAAAHLTGRHDFTTFRASQCQANSPIRTLDLAEVSAVDIPHGTEFRFRFSARSFLHNQVRSMVGTLERVGAGAWTPEDVRSALAAANRAACGPVCPPDGLYLTDVSYPKDPFQ